MKIRNLFYFFRRCINFFYFNKIFLFILFFIFLNILTFYFSGLAAIFILFFYSLKIIIIRHFILKIKKKNG